VLYERSRLRRLLHDDADVVQGNPGVEKCATDVARQLRVQRPREERDSESRRAARANACNERR
jgi:hypothetical protein